MQTTIQTPDRNYSSLAPAWLRRLGVAGFLFFFAKGMLWLIVPWLVAQVFS